MKLHLYWTTCLICLFSFNTYAVITTKEELLKIADQVDTITIGGQREHPHEQSKKQWKIAKANEITINIDPKTNPEFQANIYKDNLREKLKLLFEVFGPGGTHQGKIKKIVYEHVGTGPEVSADLNELLAPGGTYEFLSYWSNSNSGHKISTRNPEATNHLDHALGYQGSRTRDARQVEEKDRARYERLLDDIEYSKKDLQSQVQNLAPELARLEAELDVKYPVLYVDRLRTKKVRKVDENERADFNKLDDKVDTLKRRLSDIESGGKERIEGLESKLNWMFPKTEGTETVPGLDTEMRKAFEQGKPYPMDCSKDGGYLCGISTLKTMPEYFKSVLELKDVQAEFLPPPTKDNVFGKEVLGNMTSYHIRGIKKTRAEEIAEFEPQVIRWLKPGPEQSLWQALERIRKRSLNSPEIQQLLKNYILDPKSSANQLEPVCSTYRELNPQWKNDIPFVVELLTEPRLSPCQYQTASEIFGERSNEESEKRITEIAQTMISSVKSLPEFSTEPKQANHPYQLLKRSLLWFDIHKKVPEQKLVDEMVDFMLHSPNGKKMIQEQSIEGSSHGFTPKSSLASRFKILDYPAEKISDALKKSRSKIFKIIESEPQSRANALKFIALTGIAQPQDQETLLKWIADSDLDVQFAAARALLESTQSESPEADQKLFDRLFELLKKSIGPANLIADLMLKLKPPRGAKPQMLAMASLNPNSSPVASVKMLIAMYPQDKWVLTALQKIYQKGGPRGVIFEAIKERRIPAELFLDSFIADLKSISADNVGYGRDIIRVLEEVPKPTEAMLQAIRAAAQNPQENLRYVALKALNHLRPHDLETIRLLIAAAKSGKYESSLAHDLLKDKMKILFEDGSPQGNVCAPYQGVVTDLEKQIPNLREILSSMSKN